MNTPHCYLIIYTIIKFLIHCEVAWKMRLCAKFVLQDADVYIYEVPYSQLGVGPVSCGREVELNRT